MLACCSHTAREVTSRFPNDAASSAIAALTAPGAGRFVGLSSMAVSLKLTAATLFGDSADAVNSLCGIHLFTMRYTFCLGRSMPRLTNPEQTILTSAYRLFHRHGFNRVSMDEIAAAARVTKRTLYYHFRSKDDLPGAVLEAQHQLALAAFKTFGDHL